MLPQFTDRPSAGRTLASLLGRYVGAPGVIVLALPRGGVPVGFEVARLLRAPLDLFLVRKLGVPGREELAMGAVASGGSVVRNQEVLELLDIPDEVFATVLAREGRELERRERAYRGDRPSPELRGATVIVVDDGLATGSSMRAAVAALRVRGPARLVVAVPVSPPETLSVLREMVGVDEVVCPMVPPDFGAVGFWYRDFSQTSDDEVRELLERAQRELPETFQPSPSL